MTFRTPCAITVATIALIAGSADATTITFSEAGLTHGSVVTNQLRPTTGVRVRANNFNISGSPDDAVIFDSTRTGTRDPDLEDPWSGGNLPASTLLGNMLIIQERGVSSSTPDDEGRRPAGTLSFLFDNPIASFGFDFIDFEGVEANNSWVITVERVVGSTNERATIDFSDFANPSSPFYSAVSFGDNTANRINPITLTQIQAINPAITYIDRVNIRLGGSGAIDNLTFTDFIPPPPQTIPTPAGAAAGLALLGALLTRRA